MTSGAAIRFCDDGGMVSHDQHPRFAGSYLGFLNHLRTMSGHAVYDGAPFTCTGSVDLAAVGHAECSNPIHWTDEQVKRVKEAVDGPS